MSYVTTKDGAEISCKDWGPKDAQLIHFHHGWPLSSNDWDVQMLFFLQNGYRVIAHDRRGYGRSTQVSGGHDMDSYVADVIELTDHLDLRNAVHIGHSTGGGEAARYAARAKPGRVSKVVLVRAVPPIIVQSDKNLGGTPVSVSAEPSIKLLRRGQLKVYIGYPHGVLTTHADVINPDLLAFVRSSLEFRCGSVRVRVPA